MKYQEPVTKYQRIFKFQILKLIFVWLLVVGTWFFPSVVGAAVFSTNEVVEVSEPVADDVFLAGERVDISSSVQDDAYVAGGTLDLSGDFGEDLMAAGETVTVSGTVDDDAFLAGDYVSVQGGVSVDELFAAGRYVELQEGASVAKNVYVAGAEIVIAGAVNGTVRAAGDRIEIAPGATIRGNLIVYSANPPTIAEGATITGSVQHITDELATKDTRGLKDILGAWVVAVITWFVVSLVVMYLLPNLTRTVLDQVYTNTLVSFVVGLVWLVLMVPVTILLFLVLIGWPLALLVMVISALLCLLSAASLPLVVGTWIHKRFAQALPRLTLQWQHALLGAVIVVTLKFIPIIGGLVVAVLGIIVMGVLLRIARKYA